VVDGSDRFLEAITQMDGVADEVTPDEALRTFDHATLQLFWKDWPHISSWAGSLWRKLSEDLEEPATPVSDHELDEVGGEGG
jgi:hypothetical protein